jgi:hypothetical protein
MLIFSALLDQYNCLYWLKIKSVVREGSAIRIERFGKAPGAAQGRVV